MFATARRSTFITQPLLLAGGLLVCVLAGILAVKYVAVAGVNPMKLAALPLGLLLAMALVLDKEKLFIAILLLRAGGDVVLSVSKFDLGGYAIGIGGLINLMVLLIGAMFLVREPRALPRNVLWPWAVFFGMLVVGVVRAPMMGDAIRISLSLMSYAAVFMIAHYMVAHGRDFRFCVRVVMWSAVIPVLGGLWSLATGRSGDPSEFRLAGLFAHPNIFAFYLVLVIALALYVMKQPDTRSRGWLGMFMLLLLGLLVMTKTRSAWISCAAVFGVYAVLFERRYLIYLAMAPVVALMLPEVRERVLDLGSGNEYYTYAKLNSFAWRQLIWESGLNWMQPSQYALGYGLESFVFYSVKFFPLAGGKAYGAHNIYVQIFFDLGVVGLGAFLLIFLSMLRELYAARHVDKLGSAIVILLVIAYLVAGFSDNMLGYLVFNWYFWFICGAACATWRGMRQQRERQAVQSVPGEDPFATTSRERAWR
ncbi:O-antigen ligase family protein [Uliginosibacterium sp. H1]|uniref:O-antigen ligase family protein n=1 Tax=Uliginosibacterium sp. H1 TaxID=3114757 RepID=UPI002E177237|nr:O-antigen ligase family protein [Uliginosibacterium sp. H1]